jgi:hypothetical protein
MKSHEEGYTDQRILDLYHHFAHGGMNRRGVLDTLAELAGSAAALFRCCRTTTPARRSSRRTIRASS